MNTQTKNLGVQELRAICIAAVILIHLAQGSVESNSSDYWMAFRQIINFPVAIFIFLSGYFTHFDSGQSVIEFYKKRFVRLLIPFLIWSVVYTFISILITKKTELSANSLIGILRGSSAPHLYFILVLLQLILVTPVLAAVMRSKNKIGLYLLLLITPVYLIGLYYYNISTNSVLDRYQEYCFAWIIFYILGMTYRNNLIRINLSFAAKFGLVLLAAIVSLAEMTYLNSLGLPAAFSTSQITFSSFFYSITILMLMFDTKISEVSNKLLVRIGNYSFGIYFIHIAVLIFIRISIDKFLPNADTFSLFLMYQIISALFTFIVSYYIVIIASKVLSTKHMQYLGLK